MIDWQITQSTPGCDGAISAAAAFAAAVGRMWPSGDKLGRGGAAGGGIGAVLATTLTPDNTRPAWSSQHQSIVSMHTNLLVYLLSVCHNDNSIEKIKRIQNKTMRETGELDFGLTVAARGGGGVTMFGPIGGGIKGFITGLGIGDPAGANMAVKSPDFGGGALARLRLITRKVSDHPRSPAIACRDSSSRTSPKRFVTWF